MKAIWDSDYDSRTDRELNGQLTFDELGVE